MVKQTSFVKKNMFVALTLSSTAIFIALPASAQEQPFVGQVVAVTDGDTIKVMHLGKPTTIRLDAIDCPESGQAFGTKAKEFTAGLCFRKDVTVTPHKLDKYRRTIADVTLPDGHSLNTELVKSGFAWWYRKYAPSNSELEQLEKQARESKIGLWQEKDPLSPWDFRHPTRITLPIKPKRESK